MAREMGYLKQHLLKGVSRWQSLDPMDHASCSKDFAFSAVESYQLLHCCGCNCNSARNC